MYVIRSRLRTDARAYHCCVPDDVDEMLNWTSGPAPLSAMSSDAGRKWSNNGVDDTALKRFSPVKLNGSSLSVVTLLGNNIISRSTYLRHTHTHARRTHTHTIIIISGKPKAFSKTFESVLVTTAAVKVVFSPRFLVIDRHFSDSGRAMSVRAITSTLNYPLWPVQKLTRFQPTSSVARSLCDNWASYLVLLCYLCWQSAHSILSLFGREHGVIFEISKCYVGRCIGLLFNS